MKRIMFLLIILIALPIGLRAQECDCKKICDFYAFDINTDSTISLDFWSTVGSIKSNIKTYLKEPQNLDICFQRRMGLVAESVWTKDESTEHYLTVQRIIEIVDSIIKGERFD